MSIAIVVEHKNDEGIFGGAKGWHLKKLLSETGIDPKDCYATYVFESSRVTAGPKAEGIPNRPQLKRGKYIKAQYAPQLEAFEQRITQANPNVIIAFGMMSCWALTYNSNIKAARGITTLSHLGIKTVPTYSVDTIIRDWSLRPIVIADISKAKRESITPDYNPPNRKIMIAESLDDLLWFEREKIAPAKYISCDIETKQNQITCIGFSPDPSVALVIPFFTQSGDNYWDDEVSVWNMIRDWLAKYNTVFQNGLYDMSHLWKTYGIPTPKNYGDTMLLHHALQLEMNKGLGFLASIYTDEPAWKQMGKGLKHD